MSWNKSDLSGCRFHWLRHIIRLFIFTTPVCIRSVEKNQKILHVRLFDEGLLKNKIKSYHKIEKKKKALEVHVNVVSRFGPCWSSRQHTFRRESIAETRSVWGQFSRRRPRASRTGDEHNHRLWLSTRVIASRHDSARSVRVNVTVTYLYLYIHTYTHTQTLYNITTRLYS